MNYLPLITHPSYSFPFPSKHRFPMEKFTLIVEHLQQQKILTTHNLYRPGKIKRNLLENTHCPAYIQRFIHNQQTPSELRQMGLPWSEGLLRRTLISPNGTLLAATLALDKGIACHLAGGTHHAHYDYASGFCILNDLAITAKTLLATGKAKRILIFDCDVHQGDGTARMLADTPYAFTCSIHCQTNFPIIKAHSDLDVAIPKHSTDDIYLSSVRTTLQHAIDQAKPDLILYDAGVDICDDDPLGQLNVTDTGLHRREEIVLSACKNRGIPVATVIGGGYHDDRMKLAKRHCVAVEVAHQLFCAS